MSSLLSVCPAPFQKPKKKFKKAGKKPHGVSTETPLPTIMDRFVATSEPQLRQDLPPHVTKVSSSARSHQQQHHHCNCCESSEYGATCGSVDSSHTSGYQTDDGTFEGKMLKRASRTKPANLRMTAIRDYSPCCDEELAVRRGQRVKVLYKNNDWVYAVTKSGEAGYIPYSFVRPSRKYAAGYQSEPEFFQGADAYQSGYETDMPLASGRGGGGGGRRYGGIRAQVSDVVPVYSIHTGFTGNGSPDSRVMGQSHRSPADIHKNNSFMSGYTSAVEYPAGPGEMDQRRHPRAAKSMHSILESGQTSRSPLSPRDHRPMERKPEINSFNRSYLEELVVIHEFEAKEEDEVFIAKGEVIKVFNADDPFWLWVETTPGDEGFVPRSCCSLGNHPLLQSHAVARSQQVSSRLPPSGASARHARRYYQDSRTRAQMAARQARSQAKQRFHELARLRKDAQNPVLMDKDEIQRMGSKLIVLMDYTATQEDELNIQFAETVFADVLRQGGAERIWAYCPRTDECGFVPVSLVVPPVV